MNNAVLSGVISSQPQLKHSNDSKPVSEFFSSFQNVGKSESIKQIKCVGFGKLAESMAQLKERQEEDF
jgi:single-stranded DNA-binding protein